MTDTVELAAAYISLVPSMQGVQGTVARSLGVPLQKEAEKAGDEAGKSFSTRFAKAAAVGGLGAGAALAGALIEGAGKEKAGDKLNAQLNLSGPQAEKAGRVAGSLYAGAYGDSMGDVNEAIRSVSTNIVDLRKTSEPELQKISTKALDVSTAFDQDLGGVTRAVGQLMKTGLAKDADQAFDIITKGFQSPANKADDLLDTFNEYGTQFRKLGLDGPTALGLINQAVSAGARDSDVAADALKEFSIRAVDGSEATSAGFKALGLDAAKMAGQIAAGGPAAEQGLGTVLAKLRDIKDPVKQAQVATSLFGTQAEDLGAALFAMVPEKATKDLGAVQGAAGKLGQTLNDNAATNLESFKRQAISTFVDIVGGKALPIVNQAASFLATNFGPAVDVVSGAFQRWAPVVADLAGQYLPPLLTLVGQIPGALLQLVAAGQQANTWIQDNQGLATALAIVLGTVLLPVIVGLGVQAAISAGKQVAAWAVSSTAGIRSAATQAIAFYRVAAGWALSGAAAIRSGAQTAAIWAMLRADTLKSTALLVGAKIREAAAWTISRGAMLAAAVTTKAVTAGQWLLNAALTANPIGLVIVGIVALVAGLILAYRKSETFRNIVDGALRVVGEAFSWLWGKAQEALGWLKTNWPIVLAVITGPIGLAVLAVVKNWDKITGAFTAAKAWVVGGFKAGWAAVTGIIKDPVGSAKKGVDVLLGATGLRAPFTSAKTWVTGTWKAGWAGVQNVIKDPIGSAKKGVDVLLGATGLRAPFTSAKTWVTGAFSTAWARVKRIFTDPIGVAKDTIANILGNTGLGKVFSLAMNNYAKIWDRLKGIAKAPVKFVIQTVVNKGLLGGFRAVARAIGADALAAKLVDIPLPKGFRGGGSTGNLPAWKVAGYVHGNEHVATDEEVRKTPGGHATWEFMRGLIRRGRTEWIPGMRGYFLGGGVAPTDIARQSRHTSGYPWARWAGDLNGPGNDYGQTVRAYKDGVVAAVKYLTTSYGKHVRINHGGEQTLYAHLSKILVRVGQSVRAGQKIGEIGATGNAFGDHLHFELAGGSGPLSDAGDGGSLLDVVGTLRSKITGALGQLSELGGHPLAQIAGRLPRMLADGMIERGKDLAATLVDNVAGTAGKVGSAVGTSRWAPTVLRALGIVGQPASMLGTTLRRMMQESGGNPRAINNWDINAKNGIPSKGLMQVIDPTFRAYRDPSLPNDVWNPLANIVASMRYALARYGSLPAAYNRAGGYANGTLSAAAGAHLVAERGAELVLGRQVKNFGGGESVIPADGLLGGQQLTIMGNVYADDFAEQIFTEWDRRTRRRTVRNSLRLAS